jgi:hypothetical protein
MPLITSRHTTMTCNEYRDRLVLRLLRANFRK